MNNFSLAKIEWLSRKLRAYSGAREGRTSLHILDAEPCRRRWKAGSKSVSGGACPWSLEIRLLPEALGVLPAFTGTTQD